MRPDRERRNRGNSDPALAVKHRMSTSSKDKRYRLHEIIFEADTKLGKAFDICLIVFILLSVIVVMIDSVRPFQARYGFLLVKLEWFFTIVFSFEYLLRLYCVRRPLGYALSFYGIVDLLAVMPTYLSLILPGSQYLVVIRVLRILRIFRVLKLVQYLSEASLLLRALIVSRRKITVFLFTVLTLVVVLGSMMYLIEGPENGFTSIPKGIYWAIVTLTTVGYGDISPATSMGQFLAAVVMILGYAIIAVPTGIVTVALSQLGAQEQVSTQACPSCGSDGHDHDARHCKYCGVPL